MTHWGIFSLQETDVPVWKLQGKKTQSNQCVNFYITVCMAFLAHISMKSETNALKVCILQKADPVKEKIRFCYYRLAKGVSGILSYAKEGIRLWFRAKRPAFRQLCLMLVVWMDKRILLPQARFRWGLFRCLNSSVSCLLLRKNDGETPFRLIFLDLIAICGNSRNGRPPVYCLLHNRKKAAHNKSLYY